MASHVYVKADSTVLPLLHGLQFPARDPVSHRDLEESLTAAATQTHPTKDEVTYVHNNDRHSYWGISHDLTSGNPLIMPLRVTKGDPGVSYATCRHDVAAIHIDTLVPDRDDWNQSLSYLSGCIGRCIKKLDEVPINVPKNKFELIIFRDFSELDRSLRGLFDKGGTLVDRTPKRAKVSGVLTGIPSELPPDGINLRSLHILLPEGPAPQEDLLAGLPFSSFFLSVMKGDDENVDVGEYSTRIDCYYSYQNHQPEFQLANFINLVRSFLVSMNITPEKQESLRDIARIGTIGRFFRQSNDLTNAFSSTNSGRVLDDPLSPPPRGLRSFDEFYEPATPAIHSALYKWLNQYNLRLFSSPMHQGALKDPDWTPRVFFETEKPKIFKLFDKLDGLSDKWKEQTNLLLLKDPKEDLWWETQLESGTDWEGEPLTDPQRSKCEEKARYYSYLKEGKGPQENPLSQADRNDYLRIILDVKRPSLGRCGKHLSHLEDDDLLGEILDELIEKDEHSKAAQLEFYSHIIGPFQEIWNSLSAPYTHHMLTQKYPHLRSTHNVKYLDLQIMSFYLDVEELCEKTAKFPSISKTPAHKWADYSQWEIIQRG